MVKALQINAERCKGAVQIFIVRFLLRTLSGDGAAHDDGLHLPPWFCDGGVARPAHHMAWSPSPHFLLAGLHTSGAPRATYLGRDGPVDARHDHGVALWTLAQSRLLEHTSHRELLAQDLLAPLPPPTNGGLYLFGDGSHADKRGTQNPVGQKGRISQHHPWFFGLRFVVLMAAWDN